MTRADRIREMLTKRGPMTFKQMQDAMRDPRHLLSATVWNMTERGHLSRDPETGAFALGRPALSKSDAQKLARLSRLLAKKPRKEREERRPAAPPDPLWRAFHDARVPAINPAPLRWVA